MSAKWIGLFAFAALALLAPAASADGFAGLGGEAAGFEQATPGKPLVFPRDFGPHPGFRTEWWYLTANLTDDSGASYGVQWTLFRQARAPGIERPGWASQNIWMGHAAVTTATEHLFAETFARGGVGQAGVTAEPFRAWIDDWTFAADADAPGAGLSRLTISANGPGFRYAFDLAADKPVVRQGDQGFSLKSDDGRASYYFSQPFFRIDGVLVLHGRQVKLSGLAWMDREWSSQPLAATQKGWDWFSLHFSTGAKLMVFRLRDETGRDFRAGTWIGADGAQQALGRDDIVLTPLAPTPVSGRVVPVGWKLQVKSQGIDIETTPVNAASWMATSFPYWEGPIAFHGSHEGKGYLEMTGY
ncbi:lipocalin-like domain-containing protein [uncultured Rhodoblastus sp.]|uniref:lipocalin-like domain-containing protein n=1 Tax=uncultured Rhodoblastus sp. TaxID=543037 RepID=UPI0025EA9A7F|nr:lipocalin-like domain-containing protein [uncultured Rhodoblastus sp.]